MSSAPRNPEFADALARAEGDLDALTEAEKLLNELPTLNRRKLICAYAKLARPR